MFVSPSSTRSGVRKDRCLCRRALAVTTACLPQATGPLVADTRVGHLADLDQVPVRVAHVAANLVCVLLRLGQELRAA
jgi:hypothetical protein